MNKRDQIKEDIITRIKNGTLTPGEKLPSLRALAKQYGVSITPATDACSDLVAKGWIESRPCSGFYVSENILGYGVSDYKNHMNLKSSERYDLFSTFISGYNELSANTNNKIKYNFSSTSANASFYPGADVNIYIARALPQVQSALNFATTLHDSPDLKREIMRWMLPCKCSNTANEISVMRSGTEGVFLSLRACAEPRSTIAVESPSYLGFIFSARFLDYRVIRVRSDPETGLDVDDFEHILATGEKPSCLLLSSNFSNPTGAIMPPKNKERLVKLCAEHEIPIIEDDIMGDIYFGENRPRPLKSYDNDNVIYVSGFGKCLNPVTRIGYVAGGKYADQIAFYKHLTIAYVYHPLQDGLCEFLKSGSAYRHIQFFRSHMKRILENYRDIILASFPTGTQVRMPGGGLYLWVSLPENVNCRIFTERAMEEGISVSPGYFFQPNGMDVLNCFRINCAALPWTQETKAALSQLGSIATRIAQK